MPRTISLQDRCAIVAGGGRGIGARVCLTLADAGAAVAVVDLDESRAVETVDRITAAGGRAVPVIADLTRAADIAGLVEETVTSLGGVDILVTVAGGFWAFSPYQRLHDVSDDEWELVQDLNLRYVFRLTRETVRAMLRQGTGGAIVHVTSIAGVFSAPLAASYGAAKAASISFTRSIAHEYGGEGIRVNSVAPGRIATPATSPLPGSKEATDYSAVVPLGRMGTPDEVADAVLFLTSDLARYVTGQTLLVDGGASTTPVIVPTPAQSIGAGVHAQGPASPSPS